MNKFARSSIASSAAALCLALAGCGGGGVSSSGTTVAATSGTSPPVVTPAVPVTPTTPTTPTTPVTSAATINGSILKGPVNAATVCVYKLDANATGKKGAPVAVTGATATNSCVLTAADGSYSLSLPTGTTGDLIIEASGGTYCSNEAAYDATAKTCAGTGGTPIALSVAKLTTVIEAPAAGMVASAVVTPLSTSSFANMVAAGLASVVAFRSQFAALVTTTGLPSSLSAATLANDPTLQSVLASFQSLAGSDPALLNTFLTGLATGGYRYGTGGFTATPVVNPPIPPTTLPTTPTVPANASNGILGAALATVFAGDYAFSCRGFGDFLSTGPITKFAFKINTDGTTTLNGNPWIDAANSGSIELSYLSVAGTATPTGSSQAPFNLSFNRSNGGFNLVMITVKPDGALSSASVVTNSTQYSCPTVGSTLVQTVPATFVNAVSPSFNSTIGQKIARTEVVTGCSLGGTPTVTLGTDGSAMLGAVSYAGNQISVVTDKTFDIPSFDGSHISSVSWTSGTTQPFVANLSAFVFGFDGSYKTRTVGVTKADGSGIALCNK